MNNYFVSLLDQCRKGNEVRVGPAIARLRGLLIRKKEVRQWLKENHLSMYADPINPLPEGNKGEWVIVSSVNGIEKMKETLQAVAKERREKYRDQKRKKSERKQRLLDQQRREERMRQLDDEKKAHEVGYYDFMDQLRKEIPDSEIQT